MTWTVSLELPECEGSTPVGAVQDFQNQACQERLFVYRATNDDTGESFTVDMSDGSAKRTGGGKTT